MKSLLLSLAVICGTANAVEFTPVKDSIVPVRGKLVAVDVKSTDLDDSVTFKRVRNIKTFTNGLDIVTSVYTNSTQYFDYSSQTWVATNIVTTTTTTNVVKLVEFDIWNTNNVVKVDCTDGFATSNLVGGAWFIPGDFIFADGADKNVSATVILEK